MIGWKELVKLLGVPFNVPFEAFGSNEPLIITEMGIGRVDQDMGSFAKADKEEYYTLLEKYENACVTCLDKRCKEIQEKRINKMYHKLYDCLTPPEKE